MLERPSTLHKARCLRGLALARRRWPDAPLPPYLQHRAAEGSAPLPLLHMQGEETEEEEEEEAAASPDGTTTDQGQQPEQEEEEERRAVVVFVVEELPPDLYTELMHGLRRLE